MAAIRKFLFDTDFTVIEHPEPEDTAEDAETAEDDESEPPVEEPPPPMFSEEDLEVARGQGFAEGKQEGIREAAATIDRQIADTLAQIGSRLPDLFTAQEKAVDDLQRSSILAIRALAHKVLPGMAEQGALDEIEHLATLVFERLRSEPTVVFRVNDGLCETVQTRVMDLARQKGFGGAIKVIADSGLAPGDCRIEWADGGAERKTAVILEEIDRIIAKNLGGTVDELFAEPVPVTPETAPSAPDDTAPSAAVDGKDGPVGDEPDEH